MPSLWPTHIGEKGRTLDKPFEIKLKCQEQEGGSKKKAHNNIKPFCSFNLSQVAFIWVKVATLTFTWCVSHCTFISLKCQSWNSKPSPLPPPRVNWPVTNHLLMIEHFGRSFSKFLHFKSFKMLSKGLLKLYKSSLKCKAKGPAKKRAVKKIRFFELQNMIFFSFKPSYFQISEFYSFKII